MESTWTIAILVKGLIIGGGAAFGAWLYRLWPDSKWKRILTKKW